MSQARYLVGDVFDALATLEDDSVDLVFTSPPFLALRSYLPADHPDKAKEIGSEATPADFLDTLLDVVEACDRVLAPHGSLCFELGDTYAGSGGAGGDYNADGWREGQGKFDGSARRHGSNTTRYTYGNKDGGRVDAGPSDVQVRNAGGTGWPQSKSLCGIPTLFAWSLAYGRNLLRPERTTPPWRIRNLVVWGRPNPPVGALGDKWRPASSYVTVACKGRDRWFDLDAVRQFNNPQRMDEPSGGRPHMEPGLGNNLAGSRGGEWHPAGAPPLDWLHADLPEPEPRKTKRTNPKPPKAGWNHDRADGGAGPFDSHPGGTPPLDWSYSDGELPELLDLPTAPYPGSHYATMPGRLVAPFVDCMCPRQVCRTCGKPSERITQPTPEYASRPNAGRDFLEPGHDRGRGMSGQAPHRPGSDPSRNGASYDTLGWTDCNHDNYRRGVVLDPFAGSGTTAAVALGMGRDAILVDLDERNYELAYERIGGLFLGDPERVSDLATESAV